MAYFEDRIDAGKRLAEELVEYKDRKDVVVLALPRGGVPVGFEVARALNAPLDIFLVRKLGLPGQEELAMGAIASGGVTVINRDLVETLNIPNSIIDQTAHREQQELERREKAYRGSRPQYAVRGKVVIIVDDGLATGASMRAAVEALRLQAPRKIVVAVPTAAPESCDEFHRLVEEVVCAITPEPFFGVGAWYTDFSQITDDEVRSYLKQSEAWLSHADA